MLAKVFGRLVVRVTYPTAKNNTLTTTKTTFYPNIRENN